MLLGIHLHHSSLLVAVIGGNQSPPFQVNCISTEFTPKKHGGEKGVPFRIQVGHPHILTRLLCYALVRKYVANWLIDQVKKMVWLYPFGLFCWLACWYKVMLFLSFPPGWNLLADQLRHGPPVRVRVPDQGLQGGWMWPVCGCVACHKVKSYSLDLYCAFCYCFW